MATPIVSNPAVVTTAAGTPQIEIVANPTTEPSSGGPVAVSGKTNLPDGTTLHFLLNGSPDPNVPDTTVSGGIFAFTWNDPANPTLTDRVDTITVST